MIGHETFDDFWSGQFDNVILNITPDKGYKMAFQTVPGMIESGTDFGKPVLGWRLSKPPLPMCQIGVQAGSLNLFGTASCAVCAQH
ncbi:hypothetical protein PCI56_10140 [Plesiomonas shigelloides subsp. oncorhynchi]|nr:hypothetical protein [Plesiomonas shigelloides]